MHALIDLMILSAYVIAIFFGLGIVAFLINNFIVYPIRTNRLRKNPKPHAFVKFYIGENKFKGKILRIRDKQVLVAFTDWEFNNYKQEYINTSELYAAW